MRVAFISYEFPPDTLGGIATYARQAVAMLVARGHDVTVIAGTTAASSSPHDPASSGARILRLHCANRCNFSDIAVPALSAEHAREPFDVAEVPDLYAEARGLRETIPALPIVLRCHTPLYIPAEIDFCALPPFARQLSALRRLLSGVLHRQSLSKTWCEARARANYHDFYNPQHDPERQVAFDADLVAPPSQRLAQRLRDDWQVPVDRLRVLPYVHSPAPDLLGLPPPFSARTIAFHGGVRYFKGVHILAAAMPLIVARSPGVRFTLAGASGSSPVVDCSLRAWLADRMVTWRDTAEWLQPLFAALGDRVILRGFVRPENLATHLSEADVCVFPSLFDNFPSACLEAMSAGRAIVATRSGGMEEMLGEGAGLLVAPGDSHALANAICRVLSDVELRNDLAVRARKRLLAAYSPSVIGPRHEELYAEAIVLRQSVISTGRN